MLEKTDRGTTAVPVHVLIYELIYANTGNQNTAGVVISETVPANTSFSAAASLPIV